MPRVAQLAVVLAIVALVFVPAIDNGLPMDDEFVANPLGPGGDPYPMVAELQSIGTYFSSHWWRDHYEASELYRPVTKLSIAVVHALAGAPWLQHVVNVLVHLWATALVFLIARRLASHTAAVGAAIVFGVHALHTEAVAQIVGRCDLFAFCFGAQGLLLFSGGTDPGSTGVARGWRLGLAAVLLFLAFCSKEIALGWLAFLPVFVLATGGGLRRAGLGLAVALPGLVLFLWLRHRMIAGLGEVPDTSFGANPLALAGDLERVLTAVKVHGFALGRTLFPIRLAVDHGPAVFATVKSPADLRFLLSALPLVGLVAGGFFVARRQPLLFLAMASFFGFAFVITNIPFAIGTVYAERLYYLPSVGLAFLAAWFVEWCERREKLPVAFVVLLVWGSHNAVYAFRRSFVFENTSVLAENDVQTRPDSANLQRLASEAKRERGDLRGAVEHLRVAAKLDPTFAATWLNLGACLQVLGDNAGAERAYRDGLERSREDMRAERASMHMNLGMVLGQTRRFAAAVAEHEKAVGLEPGSPRRHGFLIDALLALANEHARRGARSAALAICRRVLADPRTSTAGRDAATELSRRLGG